MDNNKLEDLLKEIKVGLSSNFIDNFLDVAIPSMNFTKKIREKNKQLLKGGSDSKIFNMLYVIKGFGGDKLREKVLLSSLNIGNALKDINNCSFFTLKNINVKSCNLTTSGFSPQLFELERSIKKIIEVIENNDFKIEPYHLKKVNIILFKIKIMMVTYNKEIVNYKQSKKDCELTKIFEEITNFKSFKEFKKSNCFKTVKSKMFDIFESVEIVEILEKYEILVKEFTSLEMFERLKNLNRSKEHNTHEKIITISIVKHLIVVLVLRNS